MRYICLLIAVLVNVAIFPVLVFADAPLTGAPVLVLASPFGVGAEQIVQLAQGSFVGPFHTHFSSIGFSPASAFFDELHQAGAWVILDARVLAQLCGF